MIEATVVAHGPIIHGGLWPHCRSEHQKSPLLAPTHSPKKKSQRPCRRRRAAGYQGRKRVVRLVRTGARRALSGSLIVYNIIVWDATILCIGVIKRPRISSRCARRVPFFLFCLRRRSQFCRDPKIWVPCQKPIEAEGGYRCFLLFECHFAPPLYGGRECYAAGLSDSECARFLRTALFAPGFAALSK